MKILYSDQTNPIGASSSTRYLDANLFCCTNTYLSPSVGGSFTGTIWVLESGGVIGGVQQYKLRNTAAKYVGAETVNIYLTCDFETLDVILGPSTPNNSHQSSRWTAILNDYGDYSFQCQSDNPLITGQWFIDAMVFPNQGRALGSVYLSPSNSPSYSGTHWYVSNLV
ncbi:hypothetical protein PPL_08395 [Heterostelium album PN500]|uniref:Uncharacterized protein n=1 Tax=Heterostelium pallidum (strain ATCC 26659 / Pp 5 / PN500) TaxID=670386 RepID=D3BI27_HETP5|nr:hypothetical protein PPL_08395 [Heterostelium album PN500]EFA78927.1 hypothetical protein PPL_08395 [Heterostelium album PN500]|eukprot:XP_020431051.1 hypothetical protein PPL_08395 [Heterostelium album PN500]